MNNDDWATEKIEEMECNPLKNPDVILLVKRPDGNWRGFMQKNGKLVQARAGDPGTVMAELITHP